MDCCRPGKNRIGAISPIFCFGSSFYYRHRRALSHSLGRGRLVRFPFLQLAKYPFIFGDRRGCAGLRDGGPRKVCASYRLLRTDDFQNDIAIDIPRAFAGC